MIKLSKKVLSLASLIYLYIPIALFLFGWTKIYVALPVAVALSYLIYRFYKEKASRVEEEIYISYTMCFVVVIGLAVIVYVSGIGNFTEQTGDWWKHNMVLNDLVTREWPVYYVNESEHSMLTYYIGMYLVPAFVGKITGSLAVAEIANAVWTYIGLLLVYCNLIRYVKVKSWLLQGVGLGLMVFFSGPLMIGQKVLNLVYPTLVPGMYDWFCFDSQVLLQYSSNWILLRWVSPQATIGWLLVLLFLEYKEEIDDYILLLLPGVLFATFPFIGILPLCIGYAVYVLLKNKNAKVWFKQVFSVSNILTLLGLGSIFILYFYGNVFAEKPDSVGFRMVDFTGLRWAYVLFVFFMVLIYSAILFKDNYKNVIYYINTVVLAILPLFIMGLWNDLLMRSSIPGLFVMMIMIYEYLNKHISPEDLTEKKKPAIATIILILTLWNGAFYPMKDFGDQIVNDFVFIRNEANVEYTLEKYANRANPHNMTIDNIYNYYTYDIEENLFYKLVARKQL